MADPNTRRPGYSDAMGWLEHFHASIAGELGPILRAEANDALRGSFSGDNDGSWCAWRARVLNLSPVTPEATP